MRDIFPTLIRIVLFTLPTATICYAQPVDIGPGLVLDS